ncbi:MAG: hypothetical protein HY758_11610 [Nitrospirae bacterium]|nr:hypothetical protein [Nitrospirota bacterium]
MTIDRDENRIYLIIPETKTLAIVNSVSKKIVSRIDLGANPYWVSIMGEK